MAAVADAKSDADLLLHGIKNATKQKVASGDS